MLGCVRMATIGVTAAALCLGAWTQAESSAVPRRDIDNLGAATLFHLPRVTVVYPARGSAVEDPRLSAERRAAFLRVTHGVDARVVADTETTAEDLRENLLVLGWNNRVLEQAPPAFRRTASGIELDGLRHPVADDDLLLIAGSPFDPGARLVFWSRIDLEADRLMVLPALGSDWGIYHGYAPVLQGMFGSNAVWPPRRDPQAEANPTTRARAAARRRAVRESAHYTMRFDPATISDTEAEAILAARETALGRAARALGVDPSGRRILLDVYASRETKQLLTGVPEPVHSLPRTAELHILKSHAFTDSPHEELHLLARPALGPAYLTSLFEGFALSHEESFRGMDVDLQAAVLIEKDQLPGLAELLDEERFRALAPAVRFPGALLLVRWLSATGGDAALARAYGLREGTVDALAAVLKRPAQELPGAFESWVRERAATKQTEIAYLKAMARAEEHRLEADYESATRQMRRALELKPEDPPALHGLAIAEALQGRYDEAVKHLERLLALGLPPDSRFMIKGRYDLGRVLDVAGRREQALAQYRRVLELPDRADLHLQAREAIETPVTAESFQ